MKLSAKKYLTLAATVLGLSLSSLSLADNRHGNNYRDGYRDGYKSSSRDYYRRDYKHGQRPVIVNNYYPRGGYYRPAPPRNYYHRDRVVVVNDYHRHDDDVLKWLGGVYIINEILHHDRH